jgi:hypothetical protein
MSGPFRGINRRERRRTLAYLQGMDGKPCRNPSKRRYRRAWEQGKQDGEALRAVFGDEMKPVPGVRDPVWPYVPSLG